MLHSSYGVPKKIEMFVSVDKKIIENIHSFQLTLTMFLLKVSVTDLNDFCYSYYLIFFKNNGHNICVGNLVFFLVFKNWTTVIKRTFVLGKAERMFNHHFASSGHVPLTNVTRSGAVTANEFKWPVTSSAVDTSSTFVISMHACGIVSGCKQKKKNK